MDIGKIDKNLEVITDINEPDVVFYDVREEPFAVYGLLDHKDGSYFCRMPPDAAEKINSDVYGLSMCSAGGRVRFSTDSEYIAINASLSGICRASHMPMTGGAGFDIYIDDPEFETSTYRHTFVPPADMTAGYTSKLKLGSRKMRFFTINFPSYTRTNAVHIGLQQDAIVGEGMKYKPLDPIVYYGSSITQGGCASRPGNVYMTIVSRRLNIDFVNLGFSGVGRGEPEMAEYIATLPMSVLVMDYDHNAPTVAHLASTHYNFYKIIRDSQPELPIVFMSKCDVDNTGPVDAAERRDVILSTFRCARDSGDKNVYYIDGTETFRGKFEDMCTVDGCHPNDIGFALMAEAVEAQLLRVLTER